MGRQGWSGNDRTGTEKWVMLALRKHAVMKRLVTVAMLAMGYLQDKVLLARREYCTP
jgi:hypothetical protein